MQRSLTADLPVEHVARVVRRHLVNQPSRPLERVSSNPTSSPVASPHTDARDTNGHQFLHTIQQQPNPPIDSQSGNSLQNTECDDTPFYSMHHVLPGGAILDDLYKWTARVENKQKWRRQRAASVSLPVNRKALSDPLLQSLKQPGGFRRHHVFAKAARQGKKPPNFITLSFIEFLCLYGHFGGEDLSDQDESSLSSDSGDTDYTSSPDEEQSSPLPARQHVYQAQGSTYGTHSAVDAGLQNHRASGLPLPVTTSQPSVARQPPLGTSAHGKGSSSYQPVQFHQLHTRETMPLMSRSRPGQILQGKATPGKAVFLLLKSFVTTGIMFLPKAFYNGGLLFSVAGTVLWALMSLWSFLLLVQTRLVIHASFGDMGGVLYGPKMKMAVLLAITLSQIGFVCAYMVFVAENLQSLFLSFSNCRVIIPMHLLILAQSFAFIPLAMIRKIQRLSVFALIADVFIIIGLGYLFYYDLKQLNTMGVGNVALYNPTYFPLFIGTLAFTYEGIGLVIPITESMKEPRKFPDVLRRALLSITTLFISLGALSYLAFGDQTKTIILLNLPSKDPMVSSIQTLYSLAICLSIPLQLFPAIRIMENGLFTTRSGKNNAVVKWQKNVFRVIVVFLCAWIAIVGSKDKLDKFVPLIGALFCIPLCFIFPPLFHMKALSLPPARRAADVALIIFGIICMISVASTTIYEWNSGDVIDPIKDCVAHHI